MKYGSLHKSPRIKKYCIITLLKQQQTQSNKITNNCPNMISAFTVGNRVDDPLQKVGSSSPDRWPVKTPPPRVAGGRYGCEEGIGIVALTQ